MAHVVPTQPAAATEDSVPLKAWSLEDSLCYFDGAIRPMRDAKVSVAAPALNYGTGCFEGIRAYWNAEQEQLYVLKLREHFDRMAQSCRMLKIAMPLPVEELCEVTLEILRRNEYREDVYIRPLAFKGGASIKLALTGVPDEFAIFTFPFGNYVDITAGLSVCVSSWRRINDNAIPARSKVTGAYINSALAVDDAHDAGFDEAIFLTADGHVSEGSSCNVFLIRGGTLVTPPVTSDILEGITRDAVMQVAREALGLGVVEREVDRSELYVAEEVFFCGTGVQVSPVTKVDGRAVGTGQPGEITLRLQEAYFRAVRGQDERYRQWLTGVY